MSFIYPGSLPFPGRYLLPREKAFIKELRNRLPQAVVISDVFPYSPAGVPLLEAPRVFDRLWRNVQKLKLQGRRTILSGLINMRNIFQVMVSADHRYGPIFNQGAATVIKKELLEAGYSPGSGAPVVIIGYSGGGQVAVGATTFLTNWLRAPISVISIGGVMASDPGMHFVHRLHHLHGDKDNIEKLGAVMFPERWSLMGHSEWNSAKQTGRITLHKMQNVRHAGVRGYFGLVKFDGLSNSQRTLDEVERILSISPANNTDSQEN